MGVRRWRRLYVEQGLGARSMHLEADHISPLQHVYRYDVIACCNLHTYRARGFISMIRKSYLLHERNPSHTHTHTHTHTHARARAHLQGIEGRGDHRCPRITQTSRARDLHDVNNSAMRKRTIDQYTSSAVNYAYDTEPRGRRGRDFLIIRIMSGS